MGIQEVLKEIENDPDTIKTFQVNPKQKIGSLSVKEFTQLMDDLIEKKVSQLLIDHEVKRMSFESFSHEEVAGDTNSYLTSRRIEIRDILKKQFKDLINIITDSNYAQIFNSFTYSQPLDIVKLKRLLRKHMNKFIRNTKDGQRIYIYNNKYSLENPLICENPIEYTISPDETFRNHFLITLKCKNYSIVRAVKFFNRESTFFIHSRSDKYENSPWNFAIVDAKSGEFLAFSHNRKPIKTSLFNDRYTGTGFRET